MDFYSTFSKMKTSPPPKKKAKQNKTKQQPLKTIQMFKGEKGRSVIQCFSHHGGVLSNWHQDGHLGKHQLWAPFYDSNVL